MRVPIASKHAPRPSGFPIRATRLQKLRQLFHHPTPKSISAPGFFICTTRIITWTCSFQYNCSFVASGHFSKLSLDCRFPFSVRPFTCHLYSFYSTAQLITISDVSRIRTTTGDGKRRPVSLTLYSSLMFLIVVTVVIVIVVVASHLSCSLHFSYISYTRPSRHLLLNVNIENPLQTQ